MPRWGRRQEPAADEPEESNDADVVLWSDDDGLIVAGSSAAVAHVVTQLEAVGGAGGVPGTDLSADALAAFASGYADGVTTVRYIRHSDRSIGLLHEHGAIPTEGGAFRSFVIGSDGFAGNLDWQAIDVGPERALAFQNAAIGLALRTAVKQVELAVERVEEKVDRIAALLRAERLGNVLGDRRTLESLVQRSHGEGLSSADWASIATIGPAVTRDLERLRAHVRFQLAEAEAGWRPRSRASAAGELLADDVLTETLALVVVAEHNLSLWQRLRVDHIRTREPDHLESGIRHARKAMREHVEQDQLLLDQLREVQGRLLEPAAMDGLAPIQSHRLKKAGQDLDALASWFADQRGLDIETLELSPRPGMRDSLRYVRVQSLGVARSARKGLRRGDGTDAPELPEATDEAETAGD